MTHNYFIHSHHIARIPVPPVINAVSKHCLRSLDYARRNGVAEPIGTRPQQYTLVACESIGWIGVLWGTLSQQGKRSHMSRRTLGRASTSARREGLTHRRTDYGNNGYKRTQDLAHNYSVAALPDPAVLPQRPILSTKLPPCSENLAPNTDARGRSARSLVSRRGKDGCVPSRQQLRSQTTLNLPLTSRVVRTRSCTHIHCCAISSLLLEGQVAT